MEDKAFLEIQKEYDFYCAQANILSLLHDSHQPKTIKFDIK